MSTISIIIAIGIIGIAIIAKSNWRPAMPNNIRWGWIAGAVGLALVAWGIVYLASRPATPTAVTYAPAPRQVVPAQRPWTFKTLEIPPQGIPVYLYLGAKGFPQGGAITITTPDGKLFHDRPGTLIQLEPQEGIYIYRADPEGSKRSIMVYNRW